MTPAAGRSGLCYFSNGRIMAILLRLGSFVWLNDALHMRTMTGARTSLARLTSQVGSGSSSHCFAADSFKMEAISSTVAGRQAESSSGTWRTSIVGGNDAAVDARMRSIFDVKYCAWSSAVRQEVLSDCGCSNGRSLDHKVFESP